MKRSSNTLLIAVVLFVLAGCQSAQTTDHQANTDQTHAVTLEQCLPDLSAVQLPDHGIVEIYWPNGNLRYLAILKDGEIQIAECYTPDKQIVLMTVTEAAKESGTKVGNLAALRFRTIESGIHAGDEDYMFNGSAYLDIDTDYATVPSAYYIAETINGVMQLSDTDPPVALVIDRDTIALILPKPSTKPNETEAFLSHVLTTFIDRDALQSVRNPSARAKASH